MGNIDGRSSGGGSQNTGTEPARRRRQARKRRSFVPDAAEHDLPEGWPTEPLALHFLHQEVESAQNSHREFIEQACKSPTSFFAVESVVPGRALDIKDILTGRRFHVLEQSASRTLRAGDVTFTRVVATGGGSIMIGACPWVRGVTAGEAVERLAPIATLRGEAHVADEVYDATGALVSAELTWIKAGNRQHKDWDNTTLGTLRIDVSRFVVEVNSARRRRRIEKEIAKRLGPGATLVDATVAESVSSS